MGVKVPFTIQCWKAQLCLMCKRSGANMDGVDNYPCTGGFHTARVNGLEGATIHDHLCLNLLYMCMMKQISKG